MSSGNPCRHVSPAAVSLRSEHDETLVFESRFESANLAKAVQMFVGHFSLITFHAFVVAARQRRRTHYVFRLSVRPFVRSFCSPGQMILPRYLMNGVSSLDESYRGYSIASTDDLIRFLRLKVKVTTGCWGQIMWTPYLINYLSNLDETYTE